MPETKFISNKPDLAEAIRCLAVDGKVFFVESMAGLRDDKVLPVELWKCPELFLPEKVFFIVKSMDDVICKERISMNGSGSYFLEVRPDTEYVVLQTGGEWDGEGGPRWVMGSIRSHCRTEGEKSFYRNVKTKLLKHFVARPFQFMTKLAMGPTTLNTVENIPLATW